MADNLFKNIPSVSELLETKRLKELVDRVSHTSVVGEVRTFLDELRKEVASRSEELPTIPSVTEIADRVATWITRAEQPRLRPVINATGILLHTGLGRAPLANEAIEAVAAVAGNYASLEIDLETGERGQRVTAVEKLLCQLTGAEAATVVNNNAGATVLTLAAMAANREVIVSRGQLIEIGGSYRLPEVMAAGGARLREVGTTNKTRISDYEQAVGEQTAAIMRVHTSNYRIVGFTEEPSLQDLVRAAHRHQLPLIDDIGSGALHDLAPWGLHGEPVARQSIAAGADLVLFSGDKLLGGPQCGIILGRGSLVDQIICHPLMRALRVGKMTLAALEATLKLHRDVAKAKASIPLMQALTVSEENLKGRAERLATQISALRAVAAAEPLRDTSQLGGGAVPATDIVTWCVAITPALQSVDEMAKSLRIGTPSVFGRVQKNRLLLDLRSVTPHQESALVRAIEQLAAAAESTP